MQHQWLTLRIFCTNNVHSALTDLSMCTNQTRSFLVKNKNESLKRSKGSFSVQAPEIQARWKFKVELFEFEKKSYFGSRQHVHLHWVHLEVGVEGLDQLPAANLLLLHQVTELVGLRDIKLTARTLWWKGWIPWSWEYWNVLTRQIAGAASSKVQPFPGPWMIDP